MTGTRVLVSLIQFWQNSAHILQISTQWCKMKHYGHIPDRTCVFPIILGILIISSCIIPGYADGTRMYGTWKDRKRQRLCEKELRCPYRQSCLGLIPASVRQYCEDLRKAMDANNCPQAICEGYGSSQKICSNTPPSQDFEEVKEALCPIGMQCYKVIPQSTTPAPASVTATPITTTTTTATATGTASTKSVSEAHTSSTTTSDDHTDQTTGPTIATTTPDTGSTTDAADTTNSADTTYSLDATATASTTDSGRTTNTEITTTAGVSTEATTSTASTTTADPDAPMGHGGGQGRKP